MKFASANGLARAKFHFTILDRQPAWDRVRRELVQTYKAPFKLKESFQSLNLVKGKPWTDDAAYLDSDIFTFSFCLSEVWALDSKGSVTAFLNEAIDGAKVGAIFCYVDNGGTAFTPRVEAIFDEHSEIELIATKDDPRILMNFDEQCCVVETPFRERFRQRPKLTGNVSMRVWIKT